MGDTKPIVWIKLPVRAKPSSSSVVIHTPPLVARWVRVFEVSSRRTSTNAARRPECAREFVFRGCALLLAAVTLARRE